MRATGTRNGPPVVAMKRTPKSGKDCFLTKNMSTVTGTACAAFAVMALEDGKGRAGVFSPEDWAEPDVFYAALQKVGTPRDEIIETLFYVYCDITLFLNIHSVIYPNHLFSTQMFMYVVATL